MRSTILPVALAAMFAASTAFAVPIAAPGTEGFKIIASGGSVTARYEGSTAAYDNTLYLDNGDSDYTNDLFVFNNKTSSLGATLNLGAFMSGTELKFRLKVNTTGDNFFSGPASRNPNGKAHNRVQSNWLTAGTTLVSFEDLYNGPFDYNDLSYSFTNTTGVAPVPVPATFGLLAAAVGGIAAMRRRKQA